MHKNQEIYFIVIIGIILGLLLVGFIVTMLFLYQRRQHKQEQEMAIIKDKYEKEVLRSQLEIQENTFKTIAQELHDNIGQTLSVVKLSLSVLPLEKEHPAYEQSKGLQELLNKAVYDLSDLTKSLYTDRITDVGLVESMKFELATIKKTGVLDIQFHATGMEFDLSEQKAIFLFRMFQEMLNNVLKHSQATRISVSVNYFDDETFTLKVEDNGVGFDVTAKRQSVSSSQGVGLKSLFNRAQLIGANIDIKSSKGNGTTIIVRLSPQNG
ncbi:MAG: ATP-binding protein [Chitinophagaceae bacterium]